MPKTQTGTVRLIREMSEKIRSMQTGTASKLQRIPSPKIPTGVFFFGGGGWPRLALIELGASEGQFARELVIGRQAGKPR